MKLSLIVGMLAAFPLWAQTAQPNPIPPSEVEFATVGGKPTSLPSMVITHLPVCYSADSCSADFALDMRNRSRKSQPILTFPDRNTPLIRRLRTSRMFSSFPRRLPPMEVPFCWLQPPLTTASV